MRIKRLRATVLLLVLIALPACGGTKRTVSDPAALLQRRAQADEQLTADAQLLAEKLLRRSEAEYEAHQAGQRPDAPTIDVLIVSGGGDWGAFGAGFLQGWKEVPATEPLAMPEFDVVTGVSTGALIAPFAFLATDSALDRIEQLYRNPQKDWVKNRWPLYFLPSNLSFAEVPGLERELRQTLTLDMVREIAASSGSGRALFVNTTNLDDAGARVFDLIDEAKRAAESGDLSRIHSVMLASAGIPGAFPYREIDGEMYVDGGVTGNIIYGGRLSEEDSAARRVAADTPGPADTQAPLLGHLQQPVADAADHGARAVARRGAAGPGAGHTLRDGDGDAAPARDRRDQPTEAERGRRGADCGNPRRLGPASQRHVRKGDDERARRSWQADGCRSVGVADEGAVTVC